MGEEFLGGLKHSADRAAMGLKSALPESVQRAGDWVDEKITGKKVITPELINQGEEFEKGTGAASTLGRMAGETAMGAAATGGLAGVGTAVRGLPLALEAAGNAGWSALTSPEDRKGAAVGAAGGAVAGNVLARTLGGAAKLTRKGLGHLYSALAPTEGAAAARAGNALERTWGEPEFQRVTDELKKYAPSRLPQTTAAAADSAAAGATESAARKLHPGMFEAKDTATKSAAWNQLKNATSEAAGAKTTAQGATPIYNEGQEILNKLPFSQKNRADVSQRIAALRNTNEVIANPGLNHELDRVLAAVDNEHATLGVLPELYTSLDSAAAGSPAIREAKKIVKEIADTRSGGQFTNTLEGYGGAKDQVKAAQAAERIRGKFMGEGGIPLTKNAQGGVPEVTDQALRGAVARETTKEAKGQGKYLDPAKIKDMENLAESLRKRELHQTAPGSGKLDEGFDTAGMALSLSPIHGVLKMFAEPYLNHLSDATKKEAAKALEDPSNFLKLIKQRRAEGRSLAEWEKRVEQVIRASTVKGGRIGTNIGEDNAP
jgi:hypothetical protein